MRCILIYALFIAIGLVRGQSVIISELNNSNQVLMDFRGTYPDWLEIHNHGSTPVSLNQIHISDKRSYLTKWKLPDTTLQAGAFLIIYASGLDTVTSTEIHSNFKLKSEGEAIYLSSASVIIDSLKKQCIPSGYSLAKDPVISSPFWDSVPSPSNTYNSIINIPIDSLSWSHEAGFVDGNDLLTIESESQFEVKYNLKGVKPIVFDAAYSPAALNELIKPENLSMIPTSVDWSEPRNEIYSPVVTAQSYYLACPVSKLETRTFLLQENLSDYVFSLSLDKNELFHFADGLFTEGYKPTYLGDSDDWEKSGFLELFIRNNLVKAQKVDFKLNGLGSRQAPQKSLRFYVKEKYGDRFWENPFEQRADSIRLKRFVLRSPSSDFTSSVIRDILFTRLLRSSNLDYLEYQSSNLFVNGEYWGLYFLKERPDKYYFTEHHGGNPENISILENNSSLSSGNAERWNNLLSYIRSNDLSDSTHFSYIVSEIDLVNFANFLVHQAYAANWDLTQRNVKIMYDDSAQSKIRFLAFDCDACFYKSDLKFFDYLASEENPKNILGVLYQKLIENHSFKQLLYRTALDVLNEELGPLHVKLQLDSLVQEVKPYILDQSLRWSNPSDPFIWENKVNEIYSFISLRRMYLLNELAQLVSDGLTVYPNPAQHYVEIDVPLGSDYKIYDLKGRLISEGQYEGSVDVANFINGSYIFQYRIGDLVGNSRFVVLR